MATRICRVKTGRRKWCPFEAADKEFSDRFIMFLAPDVILLSGCASALRPVIE